jgi:hypothetical protein
MYINFSFFARSWFNKLLKLVKLKLVNTFIIRDFFSIFKKGLNKVIIAFLVLALNINIK